jgi:hypothetical protein
MAAAAPFPVTKSFGWVPLGIVNTWQMLSVFTVADTPARAPTLGLNNASMRGAQPPLQHSLGDRSDV